MCNEGFWKSKIMRSNPLIVNQLPKATITNCKTDKTALYYTETPTYHVVVPELRLNIGTEYYINIRIK
jgi:hypothetical protein